MTDTRTRQPPQSTRRIAQQVQGKRILLWGYGLEGKATEAFLKTHCDVSSLDIFEGTQDGIDENACDLIIKSPGIREAHWGLKYTSATELFLREFAAHTIGITGTKGKSTTASMLYRALQAGQPRPALLVGNIGLPCLDAYDDIGADTIIVFELSCHQLDHVRVSPHIAVFLNLYEEHLDHYDTPERYFAAKANIATHQHEGDHFLAGAQVPAIETRARTHILAQKPQGAAFSLRAPGAHNQYNAQTAYFIATELFGGNSAQVRHAIESFDGLPHRLEYIGTAGGIEYYDDSISTIPEAAIAALGSIAHAKTILLGGMDRGIRYDILEMFMRAHPEYHYICMYASGRRMYDAVAPLPYCHYRDDLTAALALARKITPPGTACILSPAAASYGAFKNFEERGEVFRRLALGK